MRRKLLTITLLLFFVANILFTGNLEASTTNKVKYDLPYPGILPDHPLYKLKVLRDKVTTFLIRDPIKKTEYHLLLADKRIQMAKLLVDKGKVELSKETALKGENEYTLLVFMFKDINKKPPKVLFDKLERAAKKHQELLKEIINKVDEKDKDTFETVLEFSQRNMEELRKIYKGNY